MNDDFIDVIDDDLDWMAPKGRREQYGRGPGLLLGAVLVALPIGLQFGSFVPLWYVAHALGRALDIPENAPVRDQPNGFLWLVLFMASMLALMAAGLLLGFVLDVLLLRRGLGWSWERIAAHGVCPAWIVRRMVDVGSAPAPIAGPDPMHDPQLDAPGLLAPDDGFA